LGTAGASLTGYGVAVDSSNNAYFVGFGSGPSSIQLAKYNSSGTIQWQRSLGMTSQITVGHSVAVDSSSNVYVCGYSNASGTNAFQIAKYNSSGSIQWQRNLGGSPADMGYGIAVDSSGNVYVCGDASDGIASDRGMQIAKFDTSGAIQWQRILYNTTYGSSRGRSVAVDASGNVYVCGIGYVGYSTIQIAKFNTSGVIQWQRQLVPTSDAVGRSISLDLSGNVYVCGYAIDGSLARQLQLAKYDNSGNIQWQKRLYNGVNQIQGYSVAVDSSSNVYVCGQTDQNANGFQLAKYNTSGTIQWQRTLGSSSAGEIGYAITVDSSDNLYVCGDSTVSGVQQFLFAKLPNNGSLTGTYTVGGYSFVYASSSLVDADSGLSASTSTSVSPTSPLPNATTTLTDSATSRTSSVTTI
jgi:outer membrane protein assembly factor BamB